MSESKVQFSDREALNYHAAGRPGKIEIVASKPMATQRDLSLAYSPGVAVPVQAIADNPADAYEYTAKGNLVAVISNGTAILGLGNLGALASKPVMEGKAVLFKRFADVDAIDRPERRVFDVGRLPRHGARPPDPAPRRGQIHHVLLSPPSLSAQSCPFVRPPTRRAQTEKDWDKAD